MKFFTLIICVMLITFLSLPDAQAQRGLSIMELQLEDHFQPEKCVKANATILAIETYPHGDEKLVVLKTQIGGQVPYTILAPVEYISDFPFDVEVGDHISMHGSLSQYKVPDEGQEYILFVPDWVSFKENVMKLRDEQGKPLWKKEKETEPSTDKDEQEKSLADADQN